MLPLAEFQTIRYAAAAVKKNMVRMSNMGIKMYIWETQSSKVTRLISQIRCIRINAASLICYITALLQFITCLWHCTCFTLDDQEKYTDLKLKQGTQDIGVRV